MRWLNISIAVLCFLALMAGPVSGTDEDMDESAEDASSLDEPVTYIFVQEGAGGSFVMGDSGDYILTINDVIPYTIYFSDRPARDAGFVEMDQFIEGFSFDPNNPPNAAVMLSEGDEESDVVIVELTEPQYDEATSTLTYTAKILQDYYFESEWPQDLISGADDAIPEEFGKVAIVIDDCPCVPDGSCSSGWHDSCFNFPICSPSCGSCCG